jgi:hypothetical protein
MPEPQEGSYGKFRRFYIRKVKQPNKLFIYVVHDADWVTDEEIRAGRSSPAVARFHTVERAHEWCDKVESGLTHSIPSPETYIKWPELEQRVQEYRQRVSASRLGPSL